MHRWQEVLQYLANSRTDRPASKPHIASHEEHYKMSEGTSDYVNLSAYPMAQPQTQQRRYAHLIHIVHVMLR